MSLQPHITRPSHAIVSRRVSSCGLGPSALREHVGRPIRPARTRARPVANARKPFVSPARRSRGSASSRVCICRGCAIGSGDGAVVVERVGLIRRAGADRGGAVGHVFVPITLARRSRETHSLRSTRCLLAVASSGRTQLMRTRGRGSYGYLPEPSSRECRRGISVMRMADSLCWGGKGGTRILQPTRLRRYHHR